MGPYLNSNNENSLGDRAKSLQGDRQGLRQTTAKRKGGRQDMQRRRQARGCRERKGFGQHPDVEPKGNHTHTPTQN